MEWGLCKTVTMANNSNKKQRYELTQSKKLAPSTGKRDSTSHIGFDWSNKVAQGSKPITECTDLINTNKT